jgi:hypothetical protein
MNKNNNDRLYELLPAVYRIRDAEQGEPLRALLQVITEQVNIVEADIAQLYENWFIETCQDWVVPYIGDLIGYQPVHEAGEPGEVTTLRGQLRNRILIPRREVANTIRYRRRKGTLALLELLANDVAGWPARAVEFYALLGWAQGINHLHLDRGRTVDLHRGDALDRIDGPFDELAHTVDVRRVVSHRTLGRHNIPSVGVFLWRLRAYSVTRTPAYCLEAMNPHCYSFSVLGNDTPLYTRPQPEPEPTHIAGELNVPTPIRRRAFEARKNDYYGERKSIQIWVDVPRRVVPAEEIVVADLSHWQYLPRRGQVAVDPVRGRIAFPPRDLPKKGVWVSYHYGFSADIGGGEYDRPLSQPSEHKLYRVGEQETMKRITEALEQWKSEKPAHAVIEITDSGAYVEQINIDLENENQSLQIRAANRTRPVIRLLDWHTALPDNLSVTGKRGSRFTIDGLLIVGRGVQVKGEITTVTIRHTTIVPGWSLGPDCEAQRPTEPSLELINTQACIVIEHSIIGSIQVNEDQVRTDPIPIILTDSILDATAHDREALGAPGRPVAHAVLTILRSTVFGEVLVHAVELAENCIFTNCLSVARRQLGCMRFCYVPENCRTPRRYHCQPDLAEQAIAEELRQHNPGITGDEIAAAQGRERSRVRPQFNSVRYGRPDYAQLADLCAVEIKHGADDESEMGAFHDLYNPQREANLRARIDEYTPAGMEAGIILVN